MSVQFNESNKNQFQSKKVLGLPETPKMIRFLINKKIIKNEKTAGIFLLIIILVSFLSAVYILFTLSRAETTKYNLSPKVLNSLPQEIKTKIYESQKK